MSPHILLYVALLGPGPNHAAAPVAVLAPVALTVEQLREVYRDLNLRTARPRDIVAADVTPDLIELYAALHAPNDLPGSELVAMRRRIENRLELVRDRLRREQYQARRSSQQAEQRVRTRSGASAETAAGSAGGPAEERRNAQALIDLITETIEPESWQVNGGRGRIIYFSPLRVLVVRSSQDMHGQIGGALGVLP